MLRRAVVLVGLAVLLSLLIPVRVLLRQGGLDTHPLQLPGVDLAALCALAAVVPALALCHLGRLPQRTRWNLWLALLALCSLLFLLLHMNWSLELARAWLQDALAPGGSVPLHVAAPTVMHVAEIAVRVGVLVAMVGVLVTLRAVPDDEAPMPARRRKKA